MFVVCVQLLMLKERVEYRFVDKITHAENSREERLIPRPLIGITLMMNSPPEIVIAPRRPDIHKAFSAVLKSIISTAYSFVRWEKQSCIPCQPIPVEGEDEEKVCFCLQFSLPQQSFVPLSEHDKV